MSTDVYDALEFHVKDQHNVVHEYEAEKKKIHELLYKKKNWKGPYAPVPSESHLTICHRISEWSPPMCLIAV